MKRLCKLLFLSDETMNSYSVSLSPPSYSHANFYSNGPHRSDRKSSGLHKLSKSSIVLFHEVEHANFDIGPSDSLDQGKINTVLTTQCISSAAEAGSG